MTITKQLPQIKIWPRLRIGRQNNLKDKKLTRNLTLRLLVAAATVAVSISVVYSYQVVRNLILNNLKENA